MHEGLFRKHNGDETPVRATYDWTTALRCAMARPGGFDQEDRMSTFVHRVGTEFLVNTATAGSQLISFQSIVGLTGGGL
jgi:hypothetical protein